MVLAMTLESAKKWLIKLPDRGSHLRRVPFRHLWVLLLAVFLLFSIIGFYTDIMDGGTVPYIVVIALAVISGLNAMLWVIFIARLSRLFLIGLITLQFFIGSIDRLAERILTALFHPARVAPETGLHVAAACTLFSVISSYFFFTRYMGISGKETFRLQNELEMAHSIQKTLVPPISQNVRCFEIYGISQPSEKVGGDLVDVVQLHGGDTVAYLADIAGHGLQAGILMGMLKTASRTALTDGQNGNQENGGEILSMLMGRLNLVLPQVKEAHMYATFTGLRLNADGRVFYGMAASPPLLHWDGQAKKMVRFEEQQFPLGLLPVSHFPASSLTMAPGDIIVIATDGILEVTSNLKANRDVEYGTDALEALIAQHAHRPLPELAETILDAVKSYGKQVDDQTLLLVRRSVV